MTSHVAKLIRQSYITVWDETEMMHKKNIEAVDRLYRDVMRLEDMRLQNIPFGGKVVLLGGDFKQVLQVINGATRLQIVESSAPYSHLWHGIKGGGCP